LNRSPPGPTSLSSNHDRAGVEPIDAIATSLGFLDPERMRRAFVRRFGMSPQVLRRSSRRHDATPIADLAEVRERL